MFYCMFYFTCDRSFTLSAFSDVTSITMCTDAGKTWFLQNDAQWLNKTECVSKETQVYMARKVV